MLMQILAGLACLLAATLQFAVYRDPTIRDNKLRRMGRRIIVAALGIAAVYAVNAFLREAYPSVEFLILFLIAMSQALFAVSDLLPHLAKEYPAWTSRLTNSQ